MKNLEDEWLRGKSRSHLAFLFPRELITNASKTQIQLLAHRSLSSNWNSSASGGSTTPNHVQANNRPSSSELPTSSTLPHVSVLHTSLPQSASAQPAKSYPVTGAAPHTYYAASQRSPQPNGSLPTAPTHFTSLPATTSTFSAISPEQRPGSIVSHREPLSVETELVYRADIISLPPGVCKDFYYRHYCGCEATQTPSPSHTSNEVVCNASMRGVSCTYRDCAFQHPNSTIIRSLRSEIQAEFALLSSQTHFPITAPKLPKIYRIRPLDANDCKTFACTSPTCYLQHRILDNVPAHSQPAAPSAPSPAPAPSSSSPNRSLSSSGVSSAPSTLTILKENDREWEQVVQLLVSSNSASLLKLQQLTRINHAPTQERFIRFRSTTTQPATWTLFHGTSWGNALSIANNGFDHTKTKRDAHGKGHYLTAAPIMAYFWSGDQGVTKTVILVEVVASATLEVPQSDGSPSYIVGQDEAILPRYLLRLEMI